MLSKLFRMKSGAPIGCEIAQGEVRLVQLAGVPARPLLTAIAEPVPDGGANRAGIVKALRAALRRGSFGGRSVVTCLPGDALGVRSLRLPPMPDTELPAAAHYAASKEIGASPAAVKSATMKLGKIRDARSAQVEVATVTAPVDVLEDHTALLLEAGLAPLGIDGSPWALARALTGPLGRPGAKPEELLILDVGRVVTTVAVASAGEVRLLRSVPVGASRIPEIAARRLGITPEQAAKVCAAMKQESRAEIDEARRMFARELAREVVLCLNYFTETLGTSSPGAGTMISECAGGEVVEMLGEVIGIEFRHPDSFLAEIATAVGPAARWARAIGLSIYEAGTAGEVAA